MRYFCQLQGRGQPLPLDLEVTNDGYSVLVEGTRYRVEFLRLPSGQFSLFLDGRSYDVTIEEKGERLHVFLGGKKVEVEVRDERHLKMASVAPSPKAPGKLAITAPMPGKVVKVLVSSGDSVEEGQGLVVVEAMKMENELKSPKQGRIVQLSAKEGTTVEQGTVLVVVE